MALVLLFISALLVANVSGPQYVFPTIGPSLANRFQWGSMENSMVSTAVFVGVSFSGPWSAWQLGNLGSKKTLTLSSVVSFLGLLLLAETFAGYLSSHYIVCSFYLVCIGSASAASYMCALDSQARNFKSYRGLGLGLTSASMGMSGFVFSQINDKLFKSTKSESIYAFLIFYACIVTAFVFFGSLILGHVPDQHSLTQQKHTSYTSTDVTCSSSICYERDSIDKSRLLEGHAVQVEDDDGPEKKMFLNIIIASLCLSLMIILGLGYVYLTNIESILVSLSTIEIPPDKIQHLRNLQISLFSVSNCVARIAFGTLSDLLQARADVHRLWFIWLSAFGFTVSLLSLILFTPDEDSLSLYTTLIATLYGIIFGIGPVIVSEMVPKNFAKTWGWILCAPAIGGQLFNLLFGFAYNKELKNQKGKICHGMSCFITFFSTGAILAGLCTLIVSLVIYKNGLYKAHLF